MHESFTIVSLSSHIQAVRFYIQEQK